MKKRVYIFGDPVEHSKSPAMHNAAYKILGIASQYEYVKEHVKPQELEKKINKLLRDPKCAGANITIPYKEAVLPLLDWESAAVKQFGAANTVVNDGGKLKGYNTDGPGYIRSLKEKNGFNPKSKKVAIFGAGGAARAIAVALVQKNIKELSVGELDLKKAEEVVRRVNGIKKVAKYYDSKSKKFLDKVAEADLVINATPLGMRPFADKTPLQDVSRIHPRQVYSDIVYAPQRTKFLINAMMYGVPEENINYGKWMLLYQGVLAFNLFTGVPLKKVPVEVMAQVLG